MSNKKKNKKKTTSTKKKKKKKSPVQKNRIITSSGINTTVKKKKKEKITFETIKKKIKEPNIDKDKIKENIKQFGKKAKIHSLDLLTHIKCLFTDTLQGGAVGSGLLSSVSILVTPSIIFIIFRNIFCKVCLHFSFFPFLVFLSSEYLHSYL